MFYRVLAMEISKDIIKELRFNEQGLIPAVAQQYDTGEVLMLAWMNIESIGKTMETGKVFYFSRSRNKLWQKGETSGQEQYIKDMLLDCDGDTILLKVDQKGVACHTGRRNCFFKTIANNKITINQDVITSPDILYQDKDR